jgi:ATP-binding cassette subfamily B protein
LLDLLWPCRLQIVIAAKALIIAACAMLGVGQALRLLIDKGSSQGDPARLDTAQLGMFGVTSVAGRCDEAAVLKRLLAARMSRR